MRSLTILYHLTMALLLLLIGLPPTYSNPVLEDDKGTNYYFLGDMLYPSKIADSQNANHSADLSDLRDMTLLKVFQPNTRKILWLDKKSLKNSTTEYISPSHYYQLIQEHNLAFITTIADTDYILQSHQEKPQLVVKNGNNIIAYPIIVTDRDQPNNGRFSIMFRSEDPSQIILGSIEPRYSRYYGKEMGCTNPNDAHLQDMESAEITKNYLLYLNINGNLLANCTSIDFSPITDFTPIESTQQLQTTTQPATSSNRINAAKFTFTAGNFEPSWEITLTQNQLTLDSVITDVLSANRKLKFPIKIYRQDFDNTDDNFLITFHAKEVPEVYGIISPGDNRNLTDYSPCDIAQEGGNYNIAFHYYDYIFTGCADWNSK